MAAPGTVLGLYQAGGVDVWSGTTQAAALVAGAAALLLSCDPTLTPNEVRSALMNSTEFLGPSWDDYGAGLLRIDQALAYLGCHLKLFADGFESGDVSAWTNAVGVNP